MAVYSDLPMEILEVIVSYLLPTEVERTPVPSSSENNCWMKSRLFINRLKRSDLLALSLVSRTWNCIAERVLYRDVELFRNWNEQDKLKPFLKSAVAKGRSEFVRNLSFDITVLNGDSHAEDRGSRDEHLLSPLIRLAICEGKMLLRQEGIGDQNTSWSPSPWSLSTSRYTSSNILIAAYLLSILPNLRHAKILLDQIPPLWGSLLRQPSFKALTSLVLLWTSFESNQAINAPWHPRLLDPIFALPALRTLHLRYCVSCHIPDHPFLQNPIPAPLAGTSPITALTFSLSQIPIDVACYLLSQPRSLRSFTFIFSAYVHARFNDSSYAYVLRTARIHSAPHLPGYLDVVLSSQKHALEELIVTSRGEIGRENWGVPIKSLRDFETLTVVEMPLSLLLSYKSFSIDKKSFHLDELVLEKLGERLPKRLRKFKVWFWDEWCIDPCIEEIKVLIEMKSVLVPNLESVVVECWMEAQGKYDAIPVEKATKLMSLKGIGEVEGVRVEVILDDRNQAMRWNLN